MSYITSRGMYINMKIPVRNICLIAVLTAASIGSNYALIGLPNIKLMDLIVFVTGLRFGVIVGASTGILTWMVYGALNPFGFSFPIWVATMTGEATFGIVGGFLSKNASGEIRGFSLHSNYNLETALWGFILTFAYDLFTNIVYAATFGVPIFFALATGWLVPPWFGILHEGSNTILFLLATNPLIRTINSIKGGE